MNIHSDQRTQMMAEESDDSRTQMQIWFASFSYDYTINVSVFVWAYKNVFDTFYCFLSLFPFVRL